MAANDIYELRIYTQFTDQLAVNVNHFLVTAVAGAGTVSAFAIANAFSSAVHVEFKGCLCADATMYGVSATRVFPTLGQTAASVGNQGVGTFGPDAGPRQASGIITKRTGVGGRRGRGRMYVPFATSTASDPNTGRPTLDYVTALSALGGKLLTGFTAGAGGVTETLKWLLYHKPVPPLSAVVETFVPRAKWATQKRRGDYGRPNISPF